MSALLRNEPSIETSGTFPQVQETMIERSEEVRPDVRIISRPPHLPDTPRSAVGRAVHPLPVRELVEVARLAGHDEAGGDKFLLARTADAPTGRGSEVPVPLQFVALGAGMHQGETAYAETVRAVLVGGRGGSRK
ncbi:hypothetical protein GCM10020256_48590 [Streptomyces thermocoprophilus]